MPFSIFNCVSMIIYGLFINDSKTFRNQKWSFNKSIDDHIAKLSSNRFQFRKLSTRSKLQHTFKNVSAQCERADDKLDFLSRLSSKKEMLSNSKICSKNFSIRNDSQFEGRQLRKAIVWCQKIYSITQLNLLYFNRVKFKEWTSGVSRKPEWEGTKMPKVHWVKNTPWHRERIPP